MEDGERGRRGGGEGAMGMRGSFVPLKLAPPLLSSPLSLPLRLLPPFLLCYLAPSLFDGHAIREKADGYL